MCMLYCKYVFNAVVCVLYTNRTFYVKLKKTRYHGFSTPSRRLYSLQETQDICGHIYACDVILFPDYQLISTQISNSSRTVIKLQGATKNKFNFWKI